MIQPSRRVGRVPSRCSDALGARAASVIRVLPHTRASRCARILHSGLFTGAVAGRVTTPPDLGTRSTEGRGCRRALTDSVTRRRGASVLSMLLVFG